MKNSVCFILSIAIIATILVQEVVEASPAPLFFPALSRFIADLKYGSDYSGYHDGGSYGSYGSPYGSYGAYGGGPYGSYDRPRGYFGNSNAQPPVNRQPDRPDRQSQGRSYSDICRFLGRPGINTGIPSGTFCPYG